MIPSVIINNNLDMELTETIPSIPISDENFTDDYWLGWVRYDNLPYSFHISAFSWLTNDGGTTGTTELNDVTKIENVPIGYCSLLYSSDDTQRDRIAIVKYVPEDLKWNTIHYTPSISNPQSSYVRLPNKLNVNTSQLGNQLTIQISGTKNDNVQVGVTIALTITDNLINDEDFLVHVSTLYTRMKLSDFNEYDFIEVIDPDTSDIYKLCIDAFTFSINDLSVTTSNNTDYTYQYIHPMIRVHETFSGMNKEAVIGLRADPYWNSHYCIVQYDGYVRGLDGTIFESDYFNWIFGGFVGSFDIAEWKTYRLSNRNYKTDTMKNFYLISASGSNDYGYMRRIFTRDEIYKIAAIQHRITTTINQYSNAGQIYAKVDLDTKEFLTEFVYGENFRDLTDWQFIGGNTSGNYIDPDIIPDYEPETSDSEESGDSVPTQRRVIPAFGNFMTVYALTGGELATFGDTLWTSWFDQNGVATAMWENFKLMIDTGIASQTGSIDISSVLDFIVSCKIYPFDLYDSFAFVDSGSPKLFIGRGTYGLPIGNSNLYRAGSSVGYLLCGTAYIPRVFNDFRDYNNMNVTCYLPYCGTLELNPADVIGRTLNCFYAVDLWTGECTAYVEVLDAVGDDGLHRYIVGTAPGKIGFDVPLSATNSGQIAARRMSDITGIIQTAYSTFSSNIGIASKIVPQIIQDTASPADIVDSIVQVGDNNIRTRFEYANDFNNSLTRAAISAPHMSGGSGFDSFASPECCYVQMRYGIYPTVTNYKHTVGETAAVTKTLSEVSGFTICNNVDVSTLNCTEEEKSEIKMLLESGVFL